MIKEQILDRCEFCMEEANIFVCEDVDANGQTFDPYRPCENSLTCYIELLHLSLILSIFIKSD
jgi:hypothetical protein